MSGTIPELTVTVPVRPGGYISVPFVGDVKAGGMTSQELKLELEKELSKFIKMPTVSVMITAVNSFKIYLLGTGVAGNQQGPRQEVSNPKGRPELSQEAHQGSLH